EPRLTRNDAGRIHKAGQKVNINYQYNHIDMIIFLWKYYFYMKKIPLGEGTISPPSSRQIFSRNPEKIFSNFLFFTFGHHLCKDQRYQGLRYYFLIFGRFHIEIVTSI
ncbi:MAG: hypothetical protein KBH92_11255, partial [Syntrophaceae bacterium]|nr:hypothetical protein [Syntrophaceae bacterium]